MIIERDERDGIVTLRLAHGKASAMDVELMQALDRALDATENARAVILTGTGSIFSAGVDLYRVLDAGAAYVRDFFPLLSSVVKKLFALPRPVVCAANGHAIAGGAIFLLACDIRLMADGNGRVGVPELLVGVPFPASPLEVVRFAVPAAAQRMVYTGVTFTAKEALAAGVVDELVAPESLLDRAHAVATQLAAIPAEAFRLTKQQLRAPALENIEHLGEINDAQALAAWCDPATHERIRDYMARTVRK